MLRSLTLLAAALAVIAGPATARAADTMPLLRSFGTFGAGVGQFDHPLGVGVGDDGEVWVADAINDRVQEWAPAGTLARTFGSTGDGRGRFSLPEDVERRGAFVYVSDCYGQRVQRFDVATLRPAGEFTGGATRLRCPEGLDIGPGGEVWVADTFNDRVLAYDPASGALLKVLGSLPRPRDVAVHPATGDVYVAVGGGDQCASARIARLSSGGAPLGTFGTSGPGALFCPLGVHADAAGNVIASDAAGRVNVYTATGELAMELAAPFGARAFAYPYGIATDAQCRIYVVERDLARVDVYGWTAPPLCRTLPAAQASAGAGVPPVLPPAGDRTPPGFSVGWPARVSLSRAPTVTIRVRCPFEACRVTSFGRVRVEGRARWWMQITRTRRLRRGVPGTVTLRFRRSGDLAAVRRLLRRGGRPRLELVVSAADARGNFARKRVQRTLRPG